MNLIFDLVFNFNFYMTLIKTKGDFLFFIFVKSSDEKIVTVMDRYMFSILISISTNFRAKYNKEKKIKADKL
jgi:hypothetical protein